MMQNDLKAHLLQNATRLTQAATNIQLDSSLFYDAIYLAIIRTRQKYKKLVNKNRAVDVCISLMKQPRKHVNQNFSSVEDCIEKAMAAKIVPWKPILSAVAVVLVAAIILPFCLPKRPVTIDPKGFVMEGTQVLANRLEGNDVQLKNFHKISDLGAANIRELANTELNADGTDVGDAQYRIHTTSNGITFLVQVYVNADTKKSEFILYKGETDGWHEVGRDDVRYRVDIALVDGKRKVFYHADDTLEMFSTPDGTLYILSCYNEGLQIHQYSTTGTLTLLDKVQVHEHKLLALASGTNWCTPIVQTSLSQNNSEQILSIICQYQIDFDVNNMCFITFDLENGIFSRPVPASNAPEGSYTLSFGKFCKADGNGGYYISAIEDIEYSETSWDSFYYIYHYDRSGTLVEKIFYGQRLKNSSNKVGLGLMEVQGDVLHLVYSIGNYTYYSIYQNGVEQSKTRIYSITKDDWDYMAVFFYQGNLYYMVEINNKYIAIAKVLENGSEKVAEFEVPFVFDEHSFLKSLGGARFSRISITDGVLSYIIGEYDRANYGWEYVSSYFFQIVLD